MLKDRINTLYQLLGCNNAVIAQAMGYYPCEISRLRNSSRKYTPTSLPVVRFAQGVYLYADGVGMARSLANLCGAEGLTREEVVPALIAWLFEEDSPSSP